MDSTTDLQGWILVGISSCACIAGASIVFIDKLWSKSHDPILESNSFLAGSMSLASGVLLFSSLSILLPASQKKLDSSTLPFVCFFGGALFTAVITKGIHWCTPDAVHACGGPPSPLHNNHFDEERPISPLPSHDSGRGNQEEQENQDSEQRCILNHNKHQHQRHYGAVPFEEAHFRIHPATRSQRLSHLRSTEHNHHHHRGDDDNNHDHQGNSKDTRDWLRIGIQTAIAIGVHKFPEGLVMFVSSQDSQELGWSVASAMSIHNLTEGFMIALPLYFALQSRSEAFCWAALLGGLSQPLGALMGLLLIENIDQTQEDVVFGVTFGLISGMMSLITVQSMLPQAIRADKGYRCVLPFFFLGIFLVSLTSILESV